ncbi:MAG: lysophospholipid acyltransferase family protein, partial [Usitatibacter sp.]
MALLRKLGTWLGVLTLWLIHFLPMRWIGAIGAGLGSLLYRFGRGRVTRINLALCFPGMSERERHDLGLRHFKMLGRNAVELSIIVWGSEEQLLRLTKVEGMEHMHAAAARGPVIVMAPHFIGLNMGGIRVAYEFPGTASIYSRQKNPVLDRIFLKARTRFGNPHLVSRQDG